MIRLHNYLNNTVIMGGGMKYVTCEQYLSIQQDVRLVGADPLQHALSMVVNGPHEPRCLSYPEELDTIEGQRAYIEAWPDLKAAFGTDYSQALPHYLSCGWREPRYPLPGTWVPPKETKVFGELPGPFFMSGMPFPDGLRIGTYKDSAGIARLYKYDGAFHELWSAPCESVYHIQKRKNGRVMFSTECPAGIGIEGDDGKITWRQLRGEPDSLAFDIWPYRGGWMVFTVSNVTYTRIKIYTSQDDGVTWQLYREHNVPDGCIKQCCTDGDTYYIYGHKNRYPYVEREDGKQTIWMKDYKDQEINYASVKDGLFTLGMNNIDDLISDGTRRNGYVMPGWTSGMYHSGIDCKPPWIMQTEVYPSGRYAVASIWNEGGYPNPEIVYSRDGQRNWAHIASVPFPSVQTMDYGDGGIYCFGGQHGQFGKVYFLKV